MSAQDRHHVFFDVRGKDTPSLEKTGFVRFDYMKLFENYPENGLPNDQIDKIVELPGFSDIGDDTRVVVYGGEDITRACRLIWTLDWLGFQGDKAILVDDFFKIASLDGIGRSITKKNVWQAVVNQDVICNYDWLRTHLQGADFKLLDVRGAGEYYGRSTLSAAINHIPGAIHLPYQNLMTRNSSFKSPQEIEHILAELNVLKDDPVVCYCQTHHRSAHTYVALKMAGFGFVRAYAGSWGEWSKKNAAVFP